MVEEYYFLLIWVWRQTREVEAGKQNAKYRSFKDKMG